MRWRYLIGYGVLIAVVLWGCAGCGERTRMNCIRTKNKAITLTTEIAVGGGRCG